MNRPDKASQTQKILAKMQALEGRNVEVISMAILLALIGAALVLAAAAPEFVWGLGPVELSGRYVPQILFAFIAVLVLVNVHAMRQRRTATRSREELVRQLLRADAAERLSMTDPLTGLFNRRHMMQSIDKEIKRAARTGRAFSLLMIDLDGFGRVNKKIGHLKGDRILNEFGGILASVFRQTDIVVRYGGDEFLVILTDTDGDQAEMALARLRREVDGWNEVNADSPYKLAFSAGLATHQVDGSRADLLAAVDASLREDKVTRQPAEG